MRTATEEAISLRYMLRALGVPVREATAIFGDNLGVLQNATFPESALNEKHVALPFHRVRECVAAGIIDPHHVPGIDNHSDICTKVIPAKPFHYHVRDLM
jgi:hypothetical protein